MRIDTRISRPKSFYNTNEYPDNQLKLFGETADITNIREKLYLVCNQDTSRKYTDPKFEVNVVNMISNGSILNINSVYSSSTSSTVKKPEEHYINDYYYEYFKPKVMLETSLDLNKTSF